MKSLTEIGRNHQTDKALVHKYTDFYEHYFAKVRYKNARVMEIGCCNYHSIKMHLEYFKDPYVLGIDIFDEKKFEHENFVFRKCDQANIEDLKKCMDGEDLFDIILDDGGHAMNQQQISFGYLFDFVKPGGIYIIEDLHTSFNENWINHDCKITTFDLINGWRNGRFVASNYIEESKQKEIYNNIEQIQIWNRIPGCYCDSVTSLIIKK